LAKAEKYRITFKSIDGVSCEVRFFYEGFTGSVTNLIGAARPFILSEFNTDEDLFKPMRPQLATINILASSSGVSIDDFLLDSDTDVDVYFKYISATTYYWQGRLLQDDFQETWIDTNHIITLRVTEGFGYLKEEELASDTRTELIGTYTILDFIKYAMYSTRNGFGYLYTIINNLFHDSMNSANTYHPLNQCEVDAKTFQIDAQTYDNSYNVLEKINRAFNQTIFMYESNWFIMRLEELYVSNSTNLRGVRVNELTGINSLIDKRYDINVGVDEEVKPISPEMLRFIKRKTKKDTIQFNYDQWDEIICNETFERGSQTLNTSTEKQYLVDSWSYNAGSLATPTTPTSGELRRVEKYDAEGNLIDNYIRIPTNASENRYIKSCGVPVLSGESFTFSIDVRYLVKPTGPFTDTQLYVLLVGTTNNYTLDNDGLWYQSNGTFTTNVKSLSVYFDGTNAPVSTDWNTIEFYGSNIPENGALYVLLYASTGGHATGQERQFKSISFKLNSRFNGFSDNTIKAIQSIYTKVVDVKNNYKDDIYLDDGISRVYKGTIYESDGVTPTDKKWFRYRYNTEEFGFRKQNAIAHWEHNRFNRNKIDANFYGLTWDDNGSTKPIGLMNTIKFVDDDPNKVYAILNLKEIDFSANTWSATLIEVFDQDKDVSGTINYNFEGIAETGVQNGVTYLPVDLIQGSQFSVSGNDGFTYNGSTPITVDITCTIEGDINDVSTTPYDAYIYLKKNGTTLSSDFINVTTTPTAFNYDLSVNGVTLNTGDTLYLQLANRIVEVDIVDSSLTFSYSVTGALTYDPYEDKYIYK